MRPQRFSIIFILLLGAVMPLCAQLSLTVEAPSTVDINDAYFQVRYKIGSASAGNLESPTIKDFDVLSGPNISVSQYSSSINGHVQSSQSTTYTYTLASRTRGTFTIPPMTVRVGGKSYRSTAVTIRVTGQGSRNSAQSHTNASSSASNNSFESLHEAGTTVSDKDLYVVARLGRKQVYEQEAVTLTYEFYERLGVGLNSIGLSQKPDFKGLVSQEIPQKSIDIKTANVGGHTCRTAIVQQYLLYPQQTGTITIPSLTFDCVVMQRQAGIDPFDAFFNGGGTIGVSLKRKVAEQTLTVKPLPQPKPAGFSGGVGHFQAKGQLLTNEVRTNDMVTYRLTISGTGNMKLLSAPTITFPSDFDTYSPKTTDKTTISVNGISGDMVFDYTFVPRNMGHYEIPEQKFIYFDPTTAEYKTIVIPAVEMEVKKGERSEEDLARERALRNSDIRPIETGHAVFKATKSYYWWNSPTYWATCILIVVLFVATQILLSRFKHRSTDTVHARQHKAAKVATKRLKAAKAMLNQGRSEDFYAELSKALSAYLSDKLNIPIAEISREGLDKQLETCGIDEPTITALRQLQDDCAYARFAPATDGLQPTEQYERAVSLITTIERQLNTRRAKKSPTRTSNEASAYDTK